MMNAILVSSYHTGEQPEAPRPPSPAGHGQVAPPALSLPGLPLSGRLATWGRRPAVLLPGTDVCRGHPDGPPLCTPQLVPGSTLGHSLGPTRRQFPRPPGDQPLLNCSASSRASRGDASCYFQGHVFLLTKEALGLGDGGNLATAPMLGGFCNLE